MYAFVFVWTPALQAGGQDVGPYLGIIFSTFMVRTFWGGGDTRCLISMCVCVFSKAARSMYYVYL